MDRVEHLEQGSFGCWSSQKNYINVFGRANVPVKVNGVPADNHERYASASEGT
jgi:hypothetical protein